MARHGAGCRGGAVTAPLVPPTARRSTAIRISPGGARSLLLTLLGEFVLPTRRPCWTGTLLDGLAGVGIEEKAARQALARASAAGWIDRERVGRRTAWRIGAAGERLIGAGSGRLRSLRSGAATWDGRWLVLHVTLPEARRADRLRVYRALSWIGFGNPTPGIWINPHADRAEETAALVRQLKLTGHTLAFAGHALELGMPEARMVGAAWDLRTVAAHYRGLAERFAAMRPKGGADTLVAHILLVNALQRLPSIDPGLPRTLLPATWDPPKHAARLWALRAKWREAAHDHWNALAAGHADLV